MVNETHQSLPFSFVKERMYSIITHLYSSKAFTLNPFFTPPRQESQYFDVVLYLLITQRIIYAFARRLFPRRFLSCQSIKFLAQGQRFLATGHHHDSLGKAPCDPCTNETGKSSGQTHTAIKSSIQACPEPTEITHGGVIRGGGSDTKDNVMMNEPRRDAEHRRSKCSLTDPQFSYSFTAPLTC